MGNNLTRFEEGVRGALEDFELPYDHSGWSDIESKLDGMTQSGSSNGLIAIVAAAGFFLIGGLYFYFNYQNAACEALMVTNTLKVDRNLPYDGITSKSQTERLVTYESGSALNEELSANTEENEIADMLAQNNPATNSNSEGNTSSSQLSDELISSSTSSEQSSSDELAENGERIGMNGMDNKNAEVEDSKALAFIPSLEEACVGVSIDFDMVKGEKDGNYLWNFGDGNFSSSSNPSHTYNKPGFYDISLSVTSSKDGQIRSKTMENLIVINPKPEAEFEWAFVNGPEEEPTVLFRNISEQATECVWSFDDESSSTMINPEMAYDTKGKHLVKLTVKNEYGCTDMAYKHITVENDYNLLAQESFSPNGDGINDTFIPKALKLRDLQFRFTVYDGKELIYESTSKRKAWNGELPSGEIASAGSYPWVVIIYNSFGEEEKYYSGTITITP